MTNLNPDQLQAVNAREGQYCLIAGPGSGKSTTLLARYSALVESGVPKTDIIFLTFTKEAAESAIRRSGGAKEQFCTFHSLGYRICTAELGHQPVEPELRHRLLIKLTRKYGLEYKMIAAAISKYRREGISPQEAIERGDGYGCSKAYLDYESERLSAGWIDFDSMLCDAAKLLENANIRQRWQFQFPLADEMQDSDNLQWRMMQRMSEKYGNVMCVGDPGQSIYQWRDAHPENLLNFNRWFPRGQHIYLGQNYRSTKTIVDYVRKKYPIETPLKEKLIAARAEQGEPIEYKKYENEIKEAEDIIEAANQDPKNSAIIGRTNRQLSAFENYFIGRSIPYQLLGRSGFWKQSEITRAIEQLKKVAGLPIVNAVAATWPQLESKYRVDDMTNEDNDALENLKTLREISKRFSSVTEFAQYANRAAHAKRQPKGITIGTIHSAKGLEWKNVFVIGCREGMMPHAKGELNEERRIFFVSISRAIDKLRISFCGSPSMFIRPDLPREDADSVLPDSEKRQQVMEQLGLNLT